MSRKTIVAIAALTAIMLSGPGFAQKIGSESIQNDPAPQEPVAPTVLPSPGVTAPVVAAPALAGPAQTAKGSSMMAGHGPGPSAAASSATSQKTQEFLSQADMLLQASVRMAGLAQDKSGQPAIRDLARQISQRDSDLLTSIANLSSRAGGSIIDAATSARMQALSQVPSGDLFDDQYTARQAGLTQQLVTVFQAESQSDDGPLRDLAAKALPDLQQIATQSLVLVTPQPPSAP